MGIKGLLLSFNTTVDEPGLPRTFLDTRSAEDIGNKIQGQNSSSA